MWVFRIAETEESLRKLELDHDAAGVTRCISCGNVGKNPQVTDNIMNENPELYQQSLLSWGANGGQQGDYEQVLAVLNRQAGLKPLTRHSKPMLPNVQITRPVTASLTSTKSNNNNNGGSSSGSLLNQKKDMIKEPLYRRAKVANQLRETPKIPLIQFTPNSSLSLPNDVYHLDPNSNNPSSNDNNNSNGNGNNNIRSTTSSHNVRGFASRPMSGTM